MVSQDNPEIKFAIDLKTTYRTFEFPGHVNGFTLGNHGAYFTNREGKKNIQFPYNQYIGHFCLGAIYTRTVSESLTGMDIYAVDELGERPDLADLQKERTSIPVLVQDESHNEKTVFKTKVQRVDKLQSILSVVKDFQFFACEKWELAHDSQGSGNTANIGSITCIEDILAGNGTFIKLGEDVFDEYWTNYGKLKVIKNRKSKKITKLEDYLTFKGMDASLINRKPPRGKSENKRREKSK